MLYCPRCRQRIDPPATTCSACGGIRGESLDGTPAEASSSWQSDLSTSTPVPVAVENSASVSDDITPTEDIVVAAEVVSPPNAIDLDFERERNRQVPSNCSKCGSTKLIPDVKVADQGDSSNGHLRVVVYGDPHALIFKDRHYENLIATICGDCGHVELRVSNPHGLYRHYLAAKK